MTSSPAPDPAGWESTAAWHELMEGLAGLDQAFVAGDRAVRDETGVVAGYRMLATVLGVGLDTYVFSDPARPAFTEINTPFRRDRRWGGDNTDAWYLMAALDPQRTYRVRGNRHDSVYFSLTVYNEPAPGAWSDRVVGILNDTDVDLADDGSFELMLGPARPEGWAGPFLELAPDTAVAVTRGYVADPHTDRPVSWEIEALDDPGPLQRTDADLARGLRSTLAWLRTLFAIVPMPVAERSDQASLGHSTAHAANEFAEPYRVPDANFGWSARDACYAFGSFDLAPDEALVITHRPPACRFWSIVPWDQYMGGHNATDGRTSVNGSVAVPNSDGTVTVVVAREQLAHPNAISTLDLARGALAFRWFLADEVPQRPTVELVKAAEAPTTVD